MKKSTMIIIGSILGVILIIGLMFGGTYNSLMSREEEVNSKFSDVDVQLERRADLIPNLVNTVKGYAKHEKEVIESVASARSKLLNAKDVSEKAEANNELSSALGRLLMVVEKYPDLKADKAFTQLQDELAGTENRIAIARKEYNNSVKSFNLEIKKFPKNMIAGMFGFKEKEYFKASESSKEVPDVSFE